MSQPTTCFPQQQSRQERQLPLPIVPPVIRAKTLMDEAMRHNWQLHCLAFQRKMSSVRRSSHQQREEFEMLWFQFRCEWGQLYRDVVMEMEAIPVPKKTNDPMIDETMTAQYLQEANTAFYPVVMMELFQREVSLEEPLALRAKGVGPVAGGRGHWAELYLFALERQRAKVQPQTVIFPAGKNIGTSQSYDDLASSEGLSSNASFASSAVSPVPHWPHSNSDRCLQSPTQSPVPTRPVSPQPSQTSLDSPSTLNQAVQTQQLAEKKVFEVLCRMATVESPQCSLDFCSIRYDEQGRNEVIQGRRSRMAEVVDAIVPGSCFLAVA